MNDAAPELVFRCARIVTPGGIVDGTVHVREGVITQVQAATSAQRSERGGTAAAEDHAEIVDLGDAVLMPGLVDTHVHVNEPGRTDWEGFDSATRAAAAGGVTTIVDMPLNSVPATTSVAALEAKRAAADGQCHVDVGFWGGLVPGNETELEPLVRAGVLGFKCFLTPSGVDEFEAVNERDLRRALPVLARLDVPLLVHAELADELRRAEPGCDPRSHDAYARTRPARAETAAVELLVRLARETGARVHVVHVAAAETLPLIRAARGAGVRITAETCPHYLWHCAEEVPAGATEYKCAPPIRGRGNRDALWNGLRAGDLQMVVSDHSPAPPDRKVRDAGDFERAWGGIASLQLGLRVVWTAGRARGFGPVEIAQWMSHAPAELAALRRKGAIVRGMDADLVVWRPDGSEQVDPSRLYHRHKLTPYAGCTLEGSVEATYVRGRRIYAHRIVAADAAGRLLSRGEESWNSPN